MAFYRCVRLLFRLLAAPAFRFRVHGAQHVPRRGPAVVVAPHRSWLDPACVGGASPRPVRFLILDRVYRVRWARWFYRRMGSIPVTQGGAGSRTALRRALAALRNGEVVGVFPEGRVVSGPEPGEVHPGAALLACRGRAPVVPMVIVGSARAWPHGRRWPGPGRVRVHVGPAFEADPGDDREAVRRAQARIESALAALAREVETA